MKATLYLKDGSTSTIFTFKQFLDMVQDYMGDDVAKWLEGHCSALEKAADRTAAAIDTDLASYEASLESNARAFQDIQDEAAAKLAADTAKMQYDAFIKVGFTPVQAFSLLKILLNNAKRGN